MVRLLAVKFKKKKTKFISHDLERTGKRSITEIKSVMAFSTMLATSNMFLSVASSRSNAGSKALMIRLKEANKSSVLTTSSSRFSSSPFSTVFFGLPRGFFAVKVN